MCMGQKCDLINIVEILPRFDYIILFYDIIFYIIVYDID